LFEMLTWNQLGFQRKPCGVLNAGSYFEQLIAFLDHAVAERFVTPEHRSMLIIERDAEKLLERFSNEPPPLVSKWMDRGTG
jgi:predicted Rossmann-fold nucleotide-binding protein